jgi:hypothetical protein
MKKVFIAGSISIKTLPAAITARIDRIIEKELGILIGDAPGVDRLVQQYLAEKAYGQVLVVHTAGVCRNNLGHWPTRSVAANPGLRGARFYAVKDRAMADGADYGLMIWDWKSSGTLGNIRNLVRLGKPVLVFRFSDGPFYELRNSRDLAAMPICP